MHTESIREFALSLPGVTEHFPFDDVTLVFKVNGKMFLLLPLDRESLSFNVKCDPEIAVERRELYPGTVIPGYHMNKTHWNTVFVNGALSATQLKSFIEESYQLVSRKRKTGK
jgi:predicted DNA-binding protein (MmcQ/YjbR family)